MSREGSLSSVLNQYREEILNVFTTHEVPGNMDFISLRKRILALMHSASYEGLRQKDFLEVVEATLPGDIVSALHLRDFKTAA